MQVGDSAHPTHDVVCPVAFDVEGDNIPGRAEGEIVLGRILDRQQAEQGGELSVRDILGPQPLELAREIGLDQGHPVGRRRAGLERLGPLPGLIEVGLGVAGKTDQ